MKSIFEPSTYEEIQNRLNQLTTHSQAAWGKMTVAQMLAHCTIPLQQSMGVIACEQKSNLFWRLFSSALYNDKLWRTNLPTAPEFKMDTEHFFDANIETLKHTIKEYHLLGEDYAWKPHIRFGQFNGEQMGKMGFKHLDHHLRQFKV